MSSEQDDTGPAAPPGGARRLLVRLEDSSVPVQLAFGYALAFAVLFAGHLVFFPWLTAARCASYAVFEAIPVALVILLVLHTERAKRQRGDSDDVLP